MKAIDTNVLVRFLVNDDPVQGEQVRQLFAAAERQREAFFVPILVLLCLNRGQTTVFTGETHDYLLPNVFRVLDGLAIAGWT